MRRKDKEITDMTEIRAIMENATICHLAMSEENRPYVIPVNFGIKDNNIYIHSALEGKKMDIIERNNNVCVEMDIDHEVEIGRRPCISGTKYKSVIAFGKAFFIDDLEEKKKALNVILDHYSTDGPYEFQEKEVNRVSIIKIELEKISGKKSGYQ